MIFCNSANMLKMKDIYNVGVGFMLDEGMILTCNCLVVVDKYSNPFIK